MRPDEKKAAKLADRKRLGLEAILASTEVSRAVKDRMSTIQAHSSPTISVADVEA